MTSYTRSAPDYKAMITRRRRLQKLCFDKTTIVELMGIMDRTYSQIRDDLTAMEKHGYVQKSEKIYGRTTWKTTNHKPYKCAAPKVKQPKTQTRTIKPKIQEIKPGINTVRRGVIVHGMKHTQAPLKSMHHAIGSSFAMFSHY